MKTRVASDKNLEKHNFFEKSVRLFSVPVLNSLPDAFLRRFMRTSSHDAEVVLDNVGSARALEVMYGRYRRNIFSRGVLQGFADLFWHHFVSQPKGVRNRLKIVEDNLDKEISRILSQKKEKEINIVTIGGGSARGIVYGENKVNFVKEFIRKNSLSLDNSYAYGDHISDLHLLLTVTNPFAVNPDSFLLKEAGKRNWPVLNFRK